MKSKPGQELWGVAFQWEVQADFHLECEMRMHCCTVVSISLVVYRDQPRGLLVLQQPQALLQQRLPSADHLCLQQDLCSAQKQHSVFHQPKFVNILQTKNIIKHQLHIGTITFIYDFVFISNYHRGDQHQLQIGTIMFIYDFVFINNNHKGDLCQKT